MPGNNAALSKVLVAQSFGGVEKSVADSLLAKLYDPECPPEEYPIILAGIEDVKIPADQRAKTADKMLAAIDAVVQHWLPHSADIHPRGSLPIAIKVIQNIKQDEATRHELVEAALCAGFRKFSILASHERSVDMVKYIDRGDRGLTQMAFNAIAAIASECAPSDPALMQLVTSRIHGYVTDFFRKNHEISPSDIGHIATGVRALAFVSPQDTGQLLQEIRPHLREWSVRFMKKRIEEARESVLAMIARHGHQYSPEQQELDKRRVEQLDSLIADLRPAQHHGRQ